jgi:hypothetical protein
MLYKKFLLVLILISIVGCVSYSKKGFKRLDVYSAIYETNHDICKEFYKNEMVSEQEKKEVKRYSMLCWASYNIAVNSLKVYQNTKSEKDKEKFTQMMKQFKYYFDKFMNYTSTLLKKYNIENVNTGHWKYKQFEGFDDSETLIQALDN